MGPHETNPVNFDAGSLIVGLLAGAVGVGYFMFGKKQQRTVFLIAGVALCVVPYVIDSLGWCIAVCVALTALPHVLKT